MSSAPSTLPQVSARDTKSHYGAIILGAGLSGLAANIQLKRKLGFTDVFCYEKSADIGGTWNHNRYPGAACDIPLSLYSFSFAAPKDVWTQWAAQPQILEYLHSVQKKFEVNNIAFHHMVLEARHSRQTGLWTIQVKDLKTGETKTRTCNILISALGGLANPNDPSFDVRDFNGDVFHSAQWNFDVSLKNKDVVMVGNGCSAAQIVPEIADEVKSLTQIARSRQSIIRRPLAPDNTLVHWAKKYIPGFAWVLRTIIFLIMERMFRVSDVKRGAKDRDYLLKDTKKYIREVAPEKYWDALEPDPSPSFASTADFDIAAKRRVFDSGYYAALNNPKVDLVQDDALESVKGDTVTTKNGRKFKADVIVLCTGFKVHDYLFPVKIYNSEGVSLQDRLRDNKVSVYQGTCVADFPNLFWLMGPNTATGHSSVIFTSEAQITMMRKLIKPILSQLKPSTNGEPAPTVEVTPAAQEQYSKKIRNEMKKKVWEKDGGVSWYVNKDTGLCTALYPFSQIHFWWNASFPKRVDFKYIGA
ncbi:BZ3500_MvSof-1268-A1-R1_Chr2-3g05328 [Microbotryum saponariae]|uniref:BZ3500_MvSof-1268-A1-R1_Chr2-3g05328 protein n=1 Tax=Microbotryum saponariae TaxID=289078 RepID=A0A2X0M173_9BASI|nr:BZ3500_MvSof-1268-A1-R1_Chr2-3g05328 [Microbotryum saponariae]SDA01205.1 BZ3501_MvSof-1269-A2-R1_Chr2-2g05001 [Microbotryum saponariae]